MASSLRAGLRPRGETKRPTPDSAWASFHSFSAAGRSSLPAATGATAATPTPAPVVVVHRRTSAPTGASRHRPRRDRCAFRAVEVRLVLLVKLLGFIVVEVFAALDQNRALIRSRLPLFQLRPRLARLPRL